MRQRLKAVFDRYAHLLGRKILGVEDVVSRYPELALPCSEISELTMPPWPGIDGEVAPEMNGGARRYSPTFVYAFSPGSPGRIEVLANGGLLIDRKFIPNTGIGNQRASIAASLRPSFRMSRVEPVIVAPWPHYMEVTYGDFLLFVLPRLCRVLNRIPAEQRRQAVIAYPLAKTGWETDYLGKLGFQAAQLVDTRVCDIRTTANGIIYAPSGEELAWTGCGAHAADYAAARAALWHAPPEDRPPRRRLYLQRNARRRILNEAELLAVLKPYGFETVDLGNHSISEQMTMVSEASFILGAQGANMNSMLWSPKGASVIEFFNRGFRPAYNLQMAYNIGLEYDYLAEQPMLADGFAHLNLDVRVDIAPLEKLLARKWG